MTDDKRCSLSTPPSAELAGMLRAYTEAFAADDEGLSLTADTWNRLREVMEKAAVALSESTEAKPLAEWHEDTGNVTWWAFPVMEPPWIGTPGDSDWPGHHTHWTPLPPIPKAPKP